MRRFKAVLLKEFAHIFRDPVSLSIVLVMPVLMIVIYGYAINFDLNEIRTGVIDYSASQESKLLMDKFQNNQYYILTNLMGKTPVMDGERLLREGKLNQYIIIPADFSLRLKKSQKTSIGVIIDGSDSNVANLVHQYNEMVIADFLGDQARTNEVISLGTKIYFNPELKSSYFFVPGIISLILIMISAFLTAMSMTREKEAGSIDLIFISPLRSIEIVIGKTIPYLIIGLVCETIILFFAYFWYQIPFQGSILILFIFSILYVLSGLSLGILVATITSSQKAALFAVFLITLLPTIMLSGFIFPLDSLGPVIRAISKVVPATYFLRIIRGVILKGADLQHFILEGIILLGFSLFLIGVSVQRFSRTREKGK